MAADASWESIVATMRGLIAQAVEAKEDAGTPATADARRVPAAAALVGEELSA